MEVQDEVLDLLFDLTYKVTNFVRNNRHCKDGPRIKDVMLFKTIYKAENEKLIYQWNSTELKYEPLSMSVETIGINLINGGGANG